MGTHSDVGDALSLLRNLLDIQFPAVSALAGDATWKGPRADDVQEDLRSIHRLLVEIQSIAVHASPHALVSNSGPGRF